MISSDPANSLMQGLYYEYSPGPDIWIRVKEGPMTTGFVSVRAGIQRQLWLTPKSQGVKVQGAPNKSQPSLGVVLQLWWVSESPRQLAKNADSWAPLPGSLIL